MASIGTIATAHKGRTTGFDYLRLGLALAVVLYHSLGIMPYWSHWILNHRSIVVLMVPTFFALSGFLITSSLFRNTIVDFIALRMIRLVPALVFQVALSAFIIGPYFTSLSLNKYFISPIFYGYLLNVFANIHYFLPGVFEGDSVNIQLWTIPYELRCYAILVAFALFNITPIKKFFPLLMLIATSILTCWACYHQVTWSPWRPAGSTLIVAFLWACVAYLFRDQIPYSAALAISAALVAALILHNPRYEALAVMPVAYVTIYIGLMALPPIRFGDLSYGIFLFHYPVLQALRYGPHVAGSWTLTALTILISCICASISWRFIEHPVLLRKFQILKYMNNVLGFRTKAAPSREPVGALDTPPVA